MITTVLIIKIHEEPTIPSTNSEPTVRYIKQELYVFIYLYLYMACIMVMDDQLLKF